MAPRDIRQPSWCRGPTDRGEYSKLRLRCQPRGAVDGRDTASCKAEDGMLESGSFLTGDGGAEASLNETGGIWANDGNLQKGGKCQ